MAPKVSICVACHNSGKTLGDTLESILAQTFRDFTLTVVNNASQDDTEAVALRYAAKDPRVRVKTFDKAVDYAANWTRCIELAEGEFSCLFHADDIYRPDILGKEVAALEGCPEAGAVLTDSDVIDEAGLVLVAQPRLPRELFERHRGLLNYQDALKLVIRHASFFMTPSLMIRTDVYKKDLAFFDSTYSAEAGDLDAFLRLLKKRPILFLPEQLVRNRHSRHSYSYGAARKQVKPIGLFGVMDHHLADGGAALISEEDRRDYDYLRLKDQVRCAVTGILTGDRATAGAMSSHVFSFGALRLCWPRPGRMAVYGCGLACRALSFIPLPGFLRAILFKIRFDVLRP